MNLNLFSERFKLLREEMGLTQSELVKNFNEKFHYSFGKSSISMYENGKRLPEVNALNDFANYFNVSIDYLLGRTDTRNGIFVPKMYSDKYEATDADFKDYDEFLKTAKVLFYNGEIAEEDKEKVMKDLLDLFWESKKIKKDKEKDNK